MDAVKPNFMKSAHLSASHMHSLCVTFVKVTKLLWQALNHLLKNLRLIGRSYSSGVIRTEPWSSDSLSIIAELFSQSKSCKAARQII